MRKATGRFKLLKLIIIFGEKKVSDTHKQLYIYFVWEM
jgi:hypothetical protein